MRADLKNKPSRLRFPKLGSQISKVVAKRSGKRARQRILDRNGSLPPALRNRVDLADVIDNKDYLLKYRDYIEKLMNGQMDIPQFMKSLAPGMVKSIGAIAFTSKNEKIRLQAMQDFLDRAGYSKVEKHAIATIDPSIPKEQLISMLEGIGKKTGTIEIEEDPEE